MPLTYTGAVLHAGNYCHFLQQAAPGNNTLPVGNGCLFNMTHPADVFATDGSDYSVSEVVGNAVLGVRGPADAKVMLVCRLAPRSEFWFWVSADGHWNVDEVEDVHDPRDLVTARDEQSLQPYVNSGGVLNQVQFRCAGGQTSHTVSLALNMNGHQFTSVTVPMPGATAALARPATPWFVDVGARLTATGTLEGTAAGVTLYDHV